jgi:2-methylcitrate dehydratase PrpD
MPGSSPAADGVTTLVTWAAGLTSADIPEDARRRALLILADDVGAMLAVRDDPQVTAVRDGLVTAGQPQEATVFTGARARGERASVAAANAAAGDWGEVDEGFRPVTCHAGLYVLPALLAEAEANGTATLDDVITAIVGAYEVITRIARTWRQAELKIHPHALLAPAGAAAGAALVRRLPAPTAVAAVSSGMTASMLGPFDHAPRGGLVRNVWPAIAAWTGIQLARWAELGIAGFPNAGQSAYGDVMGLEAATDELTQGLGERWAVHEGYHKRYACCQYTHATVEALLDVRDQLPDDPASAVERILIETHPLALTLTDANPETRLAGQFSLPHCAAAAVVYGAIDAKATSPDALTDERVTALRSRIAADLYPDIPQAPHDRPARVRVTLTDGRTIDSECLSAIGSPDRPLTPEDLLDKVDLAVRDVHPNFVGAITALLEDPTRRSAPFAATLDDLLSTEERS